MNGEQAKRIVLFSDVTQHRADILAPLANLGFELDACYDVRGSLPEKDVVDRVRGAWGVIAGGERFSRTVLESLPSLRVIARPGVGYDAIDLPAATERGVAVLITPGANTQSVADLALTLMLACLRDILQVDAAVRSGAWRPSTLARDLYGATVGILGFGQIGQAVARRLRGFDCDLLATDPFPDLATAKSLSVDLMALEVLLPRADIITVHVPLIPKTHHLISQRELRLLPHNAVVVNTSRGQVIDEAALCLALQSGEIAAAGLDVFEHEPLPRDSPLIALPNVVLSGHVASYTERTAESMLQAVVSSLVAVATGKIPLGCLNPSVLDEDGR